MMDLWYGLPAGAQDALVLAALLGPVLALALVLLRGFAPGALVGAMLWRFRWPAGIFTLVVALAVAVGVGLIAQERGLRQGTARAADGFDIVVTAPGSEVSMMLAAVYLQPTDAPLLDGATFAAIAQDPRVTLAAPLAFGDSYGAAPLVGTTAEFVTHLSGGPLAEGRMFAAHAEAVAGAHAALPIGAQFTPAHGIGAGADSHAHAHAELTVVGRMPVTGTPWDTALIVPIEAVWEVHGLANGHAPDGEAEGAETHDHEHADHRHSHAPLGRPFDPAYFPGTPAIVVKADGLASSYALRSDWTRDQQTMAFFPGAVLAQLYGLMGNLRAAMSLIALLSQALVAVSVLVGLFILTGLFARQLALLRALGAPARYVLAVVWSFCAVLLGCGAILGLAGGFAASWALARILSARTGVALPATLGWAEVHLVAGFALVALIFALVPAIGALRQPVLARLRS